MKLTGTMQHFVRHWGEMGVRWGVGRPVAMIHALLYLASQPLLAEEIAEILDLPVAETAAGLDELQSYALVFAVPTPAGSRYEAVKDVQEICKRVAEGRRRRELDPTLRLLRELDAATNDAETAPQVKQRIHDLLVFLELIVDWYDKMRKLPNTTLLSLVKLGDTIVRLWSFRL